MNDFFITNAIISDIPTIRNIWLKSFEFEISEEIIKSYLDSIYVCYLNSNKHVIGYIMCSDIENNSVLINSIAVDENYRRKQIGYKLLAYVHDDALYRNKDYLILHVRISNEAKKLYDKFGFMQDLVIKDYYSNPKEDCIEMKLNVKNKKVENYYFD